MNGFLLLASPSWNASALPLRLVATLDEAVEAWEDLEGTVELERLCWNAPRDALGSDYGPVVWPCIVEFKDGVPMRWFEICCDKCGHAEAKEFEPA